MPLEPSYYNKTPLLPRVLTTTNGAPRFFLKYEFLQPSGSFKSRGIGYLVKKSYEEAQRAGGKTLAIFSSSGGNAGLAAATAAQTFSINCTVVVPQTTKSRMIEKIRKTGAEVLVYGGHWGMADEYLREVVMKEVDVSKVVPLYVHPFDNPIIWQGHSTIVDEIVAQLKEENVSIEKVKAIVCSVGGGGLYNGIVKGLETHQLADKIPIIAVETKGCDVLNKSLNCGKPVVLKSLTSVASSLGSPYISKKAFENAKKYESKSVLLDDSQVIETCLKFADDVGIVVEPACGASLYSCYYPEFLQLCIRKELTEDDVIIVIACGGSAVSYKDLEYMMKKLGN